MLLMRLMSMLMKMVLQAGRGGRGGGLPLSLRLDAADNHSFAGHGLPRVVVSLWQRAQGIIGQTPANNL